MSAEEPSAHEKMLWQDILRQVPRHAIPVLLHASRFRLHEPVGMANTWGKWRPVVKIKGRIRSL